MYARSAASASAAHGPPGAENRAAATDPEYHPLDTSPMHNHDGMCRFDHFVYSFQNFSTSAWVSWVLNSKLLLFAFGTEPYESLMHSQPIDPTEGLPR